jgi:membrane associated rhomboid family serine protease
MMVVMGVWRELWFGVCMYLSAMAGMCIGTLLFMPITSSGPEETNAAMFSGAIIGMLVGTVAWLAYRYNKAPSKSSNV